MRIQRWCCSLVLLCCCLLIGCSPAPEKLSFKLTDITGASFGQDFRLIDHDGQPRSLADFRKKAVVVFFGYTHCPDVCPTTLGEMAVVMQDLGGAAQQVQVLFVTVDPERDTSAVLKQYVPAFHPSFLGLTGSAEEIAKTAKDFKVYFHRQNLGDGAYNMDHTAGTYIFDPQGRIRLFAQYGAGASNLSHDLKLLLNLPTP